MVKIVDGIAAKWEDVAIALGFDAPAIDCIRRDHATDCKAACTSMFHKWLNMEHADICKPVSWTVLIQGLQDAEFSSLADEITGILTVSDKTSTN